MEGQSSTVKVYGACNVHAGCGMDEGMVDLEHKDLLAILFGHLLRQAISVQAQEQPRQHRSTQSSSGSIGAHARQRLHAQFDRSSE